ncbi:MAG: hypothetical protein JO154_06690 [Chitinophaga sp.]|uniref:hypothetical protein n=1 Tax=Chitinophaga sp. TaxID=1869181 RepID=UPI0025C45852|nr:hypothetical protein [Chitinophaga sp.]MBV8252279.1 hypothetical protein [Chitinophaga sp.]
MGYELHITRQDTWYDEDFSKQISMEEWKNYLTDDPEMRLDNYAEASFEDGSVLRIEGEGLAVWTKHSRLLNVWFSYYKGNICVKSPDEEVILKMVNIAQKLDARVQGDDMEYYGKKGLILPDSQVVTNVQSWRRMYNKFTSFFNKWKKQ